MSETKTKKKDFQTQKQAQPAMQRWMIVALIGLLLLAAGFAFRDSIAAVFRPAPTPTLQGGLPANTIEQAGFVEVIQMPDVRSVYLFAEPNPQAEKIAELQPGERGELLGQDLGGEWLYVRFGEKTGWTPIYFFSVTAVE
ncbi:MAG: hypothetical protein DDG60_03815 [Anaerolineae bacterium]|nr:MAG: hypothetical protein DDG60_03815 [Anaerolineae bacterium]